MDRREDLPDEKLMALSAEGDAEAFALLVDRHADSLFALARRYLGSPALAEEAVQEAFLRLWKSAPRYRPTGPVGAYLRTLAVRVCLDGLRAARGLLEPLPDDGVLPDGGPTSEETLLEREREEGLASALSSLPPAQRMAVVLFHLEGLSVQETAELLEVSPKAVESLLSRARRTLRSRLSGLLG